MTTIRDVRDRTATDAATYGRLHAAYTGVLGVLDALVLPPALDAVDWICWSAAGGGELDATLDVPGPWEDVRGRAVEVARALGARTWRRRPSIHAPYRPCYLVVGVVGGVGMRIEVRASDPAVVPETCRVETVIVPAVPEHAEERVVCEVPTDEDVPATLPGTAPGVEEAQ